MYEHSKSLQLFSINYLYKKTIFEQTLSLYETNNYAYRSRDSSITVEIADPFSLRQKKTYDKPVFQPIANQPLSVTKGVACDNN